MLIKFLPNGKGVGAGPVGYLVAEQVLAYDANRDLIRDADGQPKSVTRDPLPEVLRGNPERTAVLIDASRHQWTYRAGVISFADSDDPTEDQQAEVMDQFERLAFAGLDPEQYEVLWVRHRHEGRVELHFCTPRLELTTGTILPKVGASRCHWHMPPKELLEDDDMPVDILVIPFPFELKAKSFKPTHEAKESLPGGNKSKVRPLWGNFELKQDWLYETDIVDLSVQLMKAAKQDVETVNVVMFPECSLNFETFGRVCSELKKIEPALEIVIAGSSDNCDPETDGPGNYAMTAVWHDFGQGPRAVISSRKKHHRWMLSANQLESYALTSTLDPRANWWETHNIGQRELHFHPFRKNSLFSTMICEDLARSEPCHEVLRSVAPNLVFVLLMDGPQIANRWSARYASTLSDDPGSSVLTLTCFGLVERSNQTQMFDRQEAVAYFSSPFGQTPIYLPYKDGARGVLITLTSMLETGQQTIDGRVSDNSRAWKLTSTQPVRPLPKAKNKSNGLAKRLEKRRKQGNKKVRQE